MMNDCLKKDSVCSSIALLAYDIYESLFFRVPSEVSFLKLIDNNRASSEEGSP